MDGIVKRITTAADADAAYVLGKIAEAERADSEAGSAKEHAEAARLEAGLRLIEVRARMGSPDKHLSGDPSPGWLAWLRDNEIPESTARRLMKLAGFSEEQRENEKAKERERKRAKRAAA